MGQMGKWVCRCTCNYRSRQFHRTLSRENLSSSLKDIGSAKSGARHQIAWAAAWLPDCIQPEQHNNTSQPEGLRGKMHWNVSFGILINGKLGLGGGLVMSGNKLLPGWKLVQIYITFSCKYGIIMPWGVNLLALGRCDSNFKVQFSYSLYRKVHCEATLRHMPQNLTNEKSTLLQVMARCHQALSHYLSQSRPRSMLPYDVTRPQWVNRPYLYHWWCHKIRSVCCQWWKRVPFSELGDCQWIYIQNMVQN